MQGIPVETINSIWRQIEDRPEALKALKAVGAGDLTLVDEGQTRSRLSRLLDFATRAAESDTVDSLGVLEDALDVLARLPADPTFTRAMIPHVARLVVRSRQLGTQRLLPFGPEHARPVLNSLLGSATEIVHGTLAYNTAAGLAKPYLKELDVNDPLRLAFTPATLPPSPTSPRAGAHLHRGGVDSLLIALEQPDSTSKPIIVSGEDLMSAIAPSYLYTLRSAARPPLGIPPSETTTHTGSQASTFGGKVYTQHEFRGKEMYMPQGLGGSTVFSRPASKHVDDYGT